MLRLLECVKSMFQQSTAETLRALETFGWNYN